MKKFMIFGILSILVVACTGFDFNDPTDPRNVCEADGGWIVIKHSGGVITDVWLLKKNTIQVESIGLRFLDNSRHYIYVRGDMEAIQLASHNDVLFDKYIEYHMEFDSLNYQQRYSLGVIKKI